jgi:nicotinamide riboside kinase
MKIGFTGTVSVGKTTLVNLLKELPEFTNYKFSTERSKYLRDLGIPLNTDSTLKGQTIFLAERCSELLVDNIITDRTVIDVMAFTQASESIKGIDKFSFNEYASNFINEYDYIFYINPEGVDIEDNGVRTIDPDYRDKIDLTIQHMLSAYNVKYHELKGDNTNRITQIKSYLNL